MRGYRTGLGVVVAVTAACGGAPPPTTVGTQPIHATAAPANPGPQRARWVFSHPEVGLHAKMDLGDGRVLYAGTGGRRELAKGNEPLVSAPTLAIGDIVAIRKAPSGEIVFITNDGTMYPTKDPMGPLDHGRPGPVTDGRFLDYDAGATAMLGIHPDGRVLRSSDFGLTWKPVDYAGLKKPFGKPVAIAMDSKGEGLVLHMPQRLYVTHDDGATWAPIASIHGMGAANVFHDGSDRVFVRGRDGALARLEGNTLVAFSGKPEPIYAAPEGQPQPAPKEKSAVQSVLVGDHVVEISMKREGSTREIKVGSARLGERITSRTTQKDLLGEDGVADHVAAYGSEIVFLRPDDDADESAPTTTVFRSRDFGATWTKDGQLQGVEPIYGDGPDVVAGPKGWLYVTGMCARDERSGPTCQRRQIRAAGGKLEDIAFNEEFEPKQFAFDEAHDRVFAIGVHEGKQHVYESPLSQNKFMRTKLLEMPSYKHVVLTVDAKGEPRVFEYDYSKGWTIHKRDDSGKEAAPSYLAADRGTLAFFGERGLLVTDRGQGWETNDAGDTWLRVGASGWTNELTCNEAGCVSTSAQRVGWDLPAMQTGDRLLAQSEPTKKTETPAPHPVSAPPREITCTVAGTPTSITAPPGNDMIDGVGQNHWASIKHESDGRMGIVVGGKSTAREFALFGALPKPPAKQPAQPEELRSGQAVLDDGVVAARYRFVSRRITGGSYNPVDVELAWWSALTGRVQHHTLTKVTPFRVSRFGFSGTPQIVDGGILFQGAATDPAYFVHDDGKVERITLPANATVRDADRLRKRWVLADYSYGGMVLLSVSDDAAKSWTQTAWGLGPFGAPHVLSMGDKVTLAYGNKLLFPLDTTLPDDPPAPIVIDDANPTTACDAHAGRHRFTSYLPSYDRPVHVTIESGKGADKSRASMSPYIRVMHDTNDGHLCTSAYEGEVYDHGFHTAVVYPEPNGSFSGWRFRRSDDPKKPGMLAEPLSCK